jgi:hypothetical protein
VLVFAREVFVSKCSTDVPRLDPNAGDMAKKLQFKKGTEADFERVPAEHHAAEDLANFKARLDRGEHWMVGEVDGEIVTYTWLHARDRAVYPSLPGCEILMGPSCGYGYDAWTPPELRGQGLRRSAFLEELHILKEVFGCGWEASFFVKHQLEGATRSLGKVGIEIIPTWRVTLNRQKTLDAECLIDDDVARPAWLEQS